MHWFVLIAILFLVFIITFGLVGFLLKKSTNKPSKDTWADKRCNVDVMFTAFKYKPENYPRTGIDFMQENFSFCVGSLIDEVFKIALTPFLNILSTNVDAIGVSNNSMNSLRGLLGYSQKGFSKLMDITFGRFKTTVYNFVTVWHRLNFAFERAIAASLSAVYAGISFFTGFLNFYDFVVQVVIIILTILLVLMFLLFFILLPVTPFILTVIAALTGAGLGAAVDGMESGFCVDPDAIVEMADGSFKPLKSCIIGDVLKSTDACANIIEGILTCDGTTEDCVRIDGIAMSKSHRVLYESHYILAGSHPEGVAMNARLPVLICLNTSNHEVPMYGDSGTIWVGDWEEVDDDAGRNAWLEMTYQYLNSGLDDTCLFMKKPTTVPLMSPRTIVKEKKKGYIPIREVVIGDYIAEKNGEWTRVTALYQGDLCGDSCGESFWYSDGVWVQSTEGDLWNTCISGSIKSGSGEKHRGHNLVTESGSYMIRHQGFNIAVRDFTEMGIHMVKQSYSMLDNYIK